MKPNPVGAALTAVVCLTVQVARAELPTCAVLTFSQKAGVTRDEAAQLSRSVAGELNRLGKYRMMTAEYVEYDLRKKGFTHIHTCSTSAQATEAGRLIETDVVVYGEDARPPVPGVNWLMQLGRGNNDLREPTLTINNVYAILRVVQSGGGLGALPEFMAQGFPDLVPVLPEMEGPQIDAYFVYPEELRHSKRIAVFRDFLLREVAEAKF